MVMPDRKKLAAPVLAQAVAFVVVLVIGGFTGHSRTPSGPGHRATPSASAGSSASVNTNAGSPSPAAKGGPKLTVKVVMTPSIGGVTLAGTQVNVLDSRTLASVASGPLDSGQEYAASVTGGKEYLVCLSPPTGWTSVIPGANSLGGNWICHSAHVGKGPQTVTFHLNPPGTRT